jgi:nitrate/nitrite transporter NarK
LLSISHFAHFSESKIPWLQRIGARRAFFRIVGVLMRFIGGKLPDRFLDALNAV